MLPIFSGYVFVCQHVFVYLFTRSNSSLVYMHLNSNIKKHCNGLIYKPWLHMSMKFVESYAHDWPEWPICRREGGQQVFWKYNMLVAHRVRWEPRFCDWTNELVNKFLLDIT